MTDETGQELQAKIWMELKTLLEGIEPGCFSHETLMGGPSVHCLCSEPRTVACLTISDLAPGHAM
jgi:hypothetical protein